MQLPWLHHCQGWKCVKKYLPGAALMSCGEWGARRFTYRAPQASECLKIAIMTHFQFTIVGALPPGMFQSPLVMGALSLPSLQDHFLEGGTPCFLFPWWVLTTAIGTWNWDGKWNKRLAYAYRIIKSLKVQSYPPPVHHTECPSCPKPWRLF